MSNQLIHHGIKGQKWGVRRFQNEDGSLTNLGKQRDSHQKSWDERKAFDLDRLSTANTSPTTSDSMRYDRKGYKLVREGHESGSGAKHIVSGVDRMINKYRDHDFKTATAATNDWYKDGTNSNGGINYSTNISTISYQDGKQWLDSIDIYSWERENEDAIDPETGKSNATLTEKRNEYVYTYGRFSQIKNKGMAFVNKVFNKAKSLINR